ncbi:MAG TPA: DUF4199 domain-containing protein [Bacteroidia bacterium]|nr:DUF4199 domain-containing protein [Bacteroidia bacterium]
MLKHSLIYGVVISFAVIALALGIYLSGVTNSATNYLSYLIYMGIIIYAAKNYRETQMGGYMSYGQSLGYLTMVALFFSLVMTIWTPVFMKVIAPDFMAQQMELARQRMEAKGLTQDQIEMGMKFSRKFMSVPFMMIFALFGNMLWLTIINLIVSAFMKKDKPVDFNSDPNLPPPPAPF